MRDPSLREDLAGLLEERHKARRGGELGDDVSESLSAAELVEVFVGLLQRRVQEIQVRATPIASDLRDRGLFGVGCSPAPSYKQLLDVLPKTTVVGKCLSQDWLLWHFVGLAQPPPLAQAVVCERVALAACSGSDAAGELVIALHVLEHASAYFAWEAAFPGSQPASRACESVRVSPFESPQLLREVAVRRVLSWGLPPSIASSLAVQEVDGRPDAMQALLVQLADQAHSVAAFPAHRPVAVAQPKKRKRSGELVAK